MVKEEGKLQYIIKAGFMLVSLRKVKHKVGFFGLQIIFIFSKPLSYGLRLQGLANLFSLLS